MALSDEPLTAIVVGINHYEFKDLRGLSTPVSDALRFVDWLIAHNVARSGIKLFLSPKSWADPEVAEWVAKQEWTGEKCEATLSGLTGFFNKELLVCNPKTVIVFWGGHGFVDDNNRRYMYVADASEREPYCVGVDDLLRSLARHDLNRLVQRVCIVDACAELYTALPQKRRLAKIPLAVDTDSISYANYIGGYAAAPGRKASGAFSTAILDKLGKTPIGEWPDFASVLTDIANDPGPLGLGKERPQFELITSAGWKTIPSTEDLPLYSALEAVKKTSLTEGQLYLLYARSLPQAADAIAPALKHEATLRHLHELPPRSPGETRPLAEFMMRLEREAPLSAVKDWISVYASAQWQAQFAHVLEKESAAKSDDYARLFIEVDTEQQKVRWYVQNPEPAKYSSVQELTWNEGAAEQSLPSLLAKIVEEVERMPVAGTNPIAIGLLLDRKSLASGIEAIPIQVREEGFDDVSMPLFHRYPVLLHWERRVRFKAGASGGGQPILGWRKLLEALKQQLTVSTTAAIKWMPPIEKHGDAVRFVSEAANHLSGGSSVEICIGFPYPGSGQVHVDHMIDACLRRGIPCFSWVSASPEDSLALKNSVSLEFAQHEPSRAPIAVAEYIKNCANMDAPAQTLRIVWDDERMLPALGSYSIPKEPQ
jgi:hypothetical protein